MLRYRATYGSELQMDGIVTVFPSIAFICHPLNGCNPVVSGTFGRSRHPQHDPASRRQDGGWHGRVGVPVAAPHTLAAAGDLRPPRIRPRWHFHTNGRVRSVALHSRPRPRRPWSEPRRSLALKTAAAWGEHLFSTHGSTRVGVHPAFRLSRTPNVRAQVSCGGTFSSLAAYPGAEFPGRGVTLSGPF